MRRTGWLGAAGGCDAHTLPALHVKFQIGQRHVSLITPLVRLVNSQTYDFAPTYFIVGGLLFQPLDQVRQTLDCVGSDLHYEPPLLVFGVRVVSRCLPCTAESGRYFAQSAFWSLELSTHSLSIACSGHRRC